jgi:hypothetical protein
MPLSNPNLGQAGTGGGRKGTFSRCQLVNHPQIGPNIRLDQLPSPPFVVLTACLPACPQHRSDPRNRRIQRYGIDTDGNMVLSATEGRGVIASGGITPKDKSLAT